MNLNLTTSRILVIISIIFIITSTNSLFSQSQEWIGFISGKNIWCLADEGQYLWIGTGGGGLVKLNKSTGEFIVYDKWNSKLPDNDVTSIAIDKQGKKWIGTDGGLVKFNGVNWTVYNTSNSGLPHNSVWAIAIDGQGNKWIGTTEGLAKFDGVNWTIYNTSNSGLPDDYVWAVAIDGEGNKWIGTAGGGLAKFDGVNWRVYNTSNSKLPNDYVTSIVIDEVGNKWIGTDGGGLVNYELNMKTWHKIIIGDSRCMKEVPDESVHLIITSPPYWQLKDYGDEKQIGFNDTYEEYINNLNLVWKECYRVLHKGCRLCINIGDQFARSVYYGRYKVIPIRTEIIKFCETIGFDYMGAIIWQKVTTCNTTGGATIMGSFPYPRNGIIKLDYEFILIFKKGGNPPKVSKEIKELSKLTREEWNQYFSGHWNFPGERQDKHLAMFPEELPKRLIKMFSFVGETFLDPFLGSGTTSLAAKNLGRNSVGYEINEDFLPIIKEKLGIEQNTVFEEATFEIIKQEELNINFKEEIKKLPYIFKDPTKFDKKLDPRKLTFGSKINNSNNEKGKYHKVKDILSPDSIILDNGLKIKLIGVKPKPEKNAEAIKFLKEKPKGQKVFIKFDDVKYDDKNNLLCYLYLWNKTFINAHLIKNGLVDVDTSLDYKYKTKFLKLNPQNFLNMSPHLLT